MASDAERPRRVVLDTNVLASALEFGGAPLQILELCWAATRIEESLRELRSTMSLVEPTARVQAISAPDSDNRILECGVAAGADAVVTGNMRHLRPLGRFQGIVILTPREFLDRFFPLI